MHIVRVIGPDGYALFDGRAVYKDEALRLARMSQSNFKNRGSFIKVLDDEGVQYYTAVYEPLHKGVRSTWRVCNGN